MIVTILRKNLEGRAIDNTLKYGCGGINIDSCRTPTTEFIYNHGRKIDSDIYSPLGAMNPRQSEGQKLGRFPTNVILTQGSPSNKLDSQTGILKSGKDKNPTRNLVSGFFGKKDNYYSSESNYGDEGGASRFFKQIKKESEMIDYFKDMITPPVEDALVLVSKPEEIDFSLYKKEIYENGSLIPHYEPLVHGIILLGSPTQHQAEEILKILKPGAHCILIPEDLGYQSVVLLEDTGFEVRDSIFVAGEDDDFFYSSKASRSEREEGLDKTDEKRKNIHPTVKPISVMKWCARDLKKKSKVVDPFLGSGTTGVAMARLNHDFVGIELNPEYAEICNARIRHWMPVGSEIKSEVQAPSKKQKSGDNISIFDL